MPVTIYHNPGCGTSRNVLALLRAAGCQPEVVEYLEAGWTVEQLQALFKAAGITAREALRTTKSPAKELGLMEEGVSEAALLAAMVEHPVLVNRPIVTTPKGTRLCRPSEAVLALLDKLPPGPFHKEDGELMIDAQGRVVSAT